MNFYYDRRFINVVYNSEHRNVRINFERQTDRQKDIVIA